ncbi:hypothetical protein [Streptomyces malaysiensis]|uniref:hypothetical protein n=1 Tax=Streptomyces malaysiensis TaxID=92644 RepID=UPI0020307FC3|nr:hypothetical protein [Streptomyces malaysiensis]
MVRDRADRHPAAAATSRTPTAAVPRSAMSGTAASTISRRRTSVGCRVRAEAATARRGGRRSERDVTRTSSAWCDAMRA